MTPSHVAFDGGLEEYFQVEYLYMKQRKITRKYFTMKALMNCEWMNE